MRLSDVLYQVHEGNGDWRILSRCLQVGVEMVLGSGEDGGGDWAAIAYSLIGSYALNHLDPYRYLTDIAPRLTDWRFTNYARLTPRAWAKQNAHAVA